MKSLRRYDLRERLYFITADTFNRQNLLLADIAIFWKSWSNFALEAWVILPDHFHVILMNEEKSISDILHRFKRQYSTRFRLKFGLSKVWQNRFWDHVIRDESDLCNHLNYIHINPVKHGLVDDPFLYEYSSLQKYYDNGFYDRRWGMKEDIEIKGNFGE